MRRVAICESDTAAFWRDMDGGRRGTPYAFVEASMECADYPTPGSPSWDDLAAVYARLRRYDDEIGDEVDALVDVIGWLREDGLFAQSDRLRTIAGRLARARRTSSREPSGYTRVAARAWK